MQSNEEVKTLKYNERLDLADRLRAWQDDATWGPVTEEMMTSWVQELETTIKKLQEDPWRT